MWRLLFCLVLLGPALGHAGELNRAELTRYQFSWPRDDAAASYLLACGPTSGSITKQWPLTQPVSQTLDQYLVSNERYVCAGYSVGGDGAWSGPTNAVEVIVMPGEDVVDTFPPIVAIVRPLGGSTVPPKAVVPIIVAAGDDRGVRQVTVRVNKQLACTMHAPPYHCSWTTQDARGQRYAIQATAMDLAGNETSSRSVTVRSGTP